MSDFPEGLATYMPTPDPAAVPLFEVGARYEIRMIIGGEETVLWAAIEAYEHPIIKTASKTFGDKSPYLPGKTIPGQIINVTSPNFISATPSQD